MNFKARNCVAHSYLAKLLRNYTTVRALRSSDFPALAAPTFKAKTVGTNSILHQDLELGTLFHHLSTDVTPGTVYALLRCYLLVNRFDGFSPDSSSLLATSVLRSMRKRANSPCGSVLAREKCSSSE